MAARQKQRYCKTCKKNTLHEQDTFSFGWGCLLTILTGGLFLIVWLGAELYCMCKPWVCQTCGGT